MLALVAMALFASDYRTQFPLPSNVVPSGWGVNIHFTRPGPDELKKLSSVFHWIRMDFAWNEIEHHRGVYDFSAYDQLLNDIDRRHLRAIFILDYGNDLYQKGSPRTDESRQAFCDFVSAGIRHFRHRGVVWEMWNEPNHKFWQPAPDVVQYTELALAVGKTIRSIAPDEWFIGPATSAFDWRFIQSCFDAGLLSYWDAVSVHPYRGSPPESVAADWDRLRGMIDRTGHHVGMISGEWGYSDLNVGIDRQRDFIARQYLCNLLSGVDLSIWYDWKNDGPSATDAEHHFGSSNQDLSPKPAFSEAAEIASELSGFRFERRLDTGDTSDYVLMFKKRGETKDAVWTTGSPHKVSVSGTGKFVELTSTPHVVGRD